MKYLKDIQKVHPVTAMDTHDTEQFMSQFVQYFETCCDIFNEDQQAQHLLCTEDLVNSFSAVRSISILNNDSRSFKNSIYPTETPKTNSIQCRIETLSKRVTKTSSLQNDQIKHFEKLHNLK